MKKLLLILFLIPAICFAQKRSTGGGSGTGVPLYATSPTVTTPSFTTGFKIGGAAASGKIPVGDGTNYVASTPTFPNASATANKIIRSDGTNWIASTSTFSDAPSTAGKVLLSDGTNWITSTPTFPNASASSGKFIRSDGTNWIASTPTLPTSAGTSGKVLLSDGTNYIESTPTFPNASATSGKIIKSDGTNWTASTETYATPGTTGNFLISDGTNWTAANTRQNWTSFVVSGSNATTTGQTLVDITGLTSGTLSNSTLYEIEAWLNVTTSAVTTGCEYGIGAGGSGGAAVVMVMLIGNSTGTTITTENIVASGTASSARLLTSGQSGMIYLHGWVTTRGSGTANISIQHLKVTSGTSTVLIGSLFRYRLAN